MLTEITLDERFSTPDALSKLMATIEGEITPTTKDVITATK